MGKSYRPYYPDEELLLPPSLREWMPEDHLAYFVSDVRSAGPVGNGRGLRQREARPTALQSADDDEIAGIRLLCGRLQFAKNRAAAGGGHRVSGAGGG